MKTPTQLLAILAAFFFLSVYVCLQLNALDNERQARADAYTLCIYSQYQMTPDEYLGEYGELPKCTN